MNTPTKIKISIIAGFLGLVSTGSAFAYDDDDGFKHGYSKTDTISLRQAAIIAQENTGAEPIEVEREFEMGQTFYEVKLVDVKGKEFEAVINAASGSVVFIQEETDIDTDDRLENIAWASGVRDGKIKRLVSAVSAAEARYKAKVYDVEFEDDYRSDKQKLAYEIRLIDADGSRIEMHIPAG